MLIILAPVMLVVAILIKLTSPGPVLFVQKRVGMNQRQFKLYKFRSMVIDAEQRKHESRTSTSATARPSRSRTTRA